MSLIRSAILVINSDFGEAFLCIGKHETAAQFFKRTEVNLHGSVAGFIINKQSAGDSTELEEYWASFIVSSDCK